MILYIKNPKEYTNKLLEVINELSKVVRYNINIQKINCISIYFQWAIWKWKQFTVELNNKILINLAKEV